MTAGNKKHDSVAPCAPSRLLVGAVAIGLLLPSAPRAQQKRLIPLRLVLNEILYDEDSSSSDPLRTHEWVEVFNAGKGPALLGGWKLADRDGAAGPSARALPSVVLPSGAYLVVHFAAGTNDLDFSDGCGEFYTGAPAGVDVLDRGMDECALYSPKGIADFVAWNQGGSGYQPGTAHDDAVAAGQWTTGSFLNSSQIASAPGRKFGIVVPGTSIGRDKDSTDTDAPEDWDANGGVDALDYTFCRQNLDRLFLVTETCPPPSPKDWTVMVYACGDDASALSIERYVYHDFEEMEDAGEWGSVMNIVGMLDGNSRIMQATLDPNGNLIPLPATKGHTWRFKIKADVDDRYVRMLSPPGQDPYLGERDMGDPNELAGFIAWAKANYPAQRYALILNGHGLGWKGVLFDDTFTGQYANVDALYMGELGSALAGHLFELIGFDACLMGMLEVAYQVQPFSNFFVASEAVIPATGWPYDQWLAKLGANPGWDGGQLGTAIVQDYAVAQALFPLYTLACIDQVALGPLGPLVPAADALATDLRTACDDFVTHEDPLDNVQYRIFVAGVGAERFDDGNFMDLDHFLGLIKNDLGIDKCYKCDLVPLQVALGVAVLAEAHGPGHPNARGLSIYMPLARTKAPDDESYDYASTRLFDGNSSRAIYAPNNECLPFEADDPETGLPLNAPSEWPRKPTPNFLFPQDTQWDEFLLRFYHPVADASILCAQGPDGQTYYPVVNDPACGNPVDEIFDVPANSTVFFSGAGSGDIDTLDCTGTHFMWDFDNLALGCPHCMVMGCGPCVAPYTVGPGVDAATADEDMNADQDCDGIALDDEKEDDSIYPCWTFPNVGDYTVHLHVWDDHHLTAFGDTNPDAQYTHPQTDSHTVIVHVQ